MRTCLGRYRRVDEVFPGDHWTVVRSGAGTGLAISFHDLPIPELYIILATIYASRNRSMNREPIDAPFLVLIGSSGRNSGKTIAACALIHALKGRFPITALKVTAADRSGGGCHRGKKGCGACSFSEAYILEEELDRFSGKDTARLLEAGAARVFWLRASLPCLERGFRAFLEKAPPDSLILGESNSLRETVKPGCFIMLKSATGEIKPSAARVADLADITIESENGVSREALEALVLRLRVEADGEGRPGVRIGSAS
jgi:hypothetical protein